MRKQAARGFLLALAAVVLWTAANLMGVEGFRCDHDLSGLQGVLIRVLVNMACVLLMQFLVRGERVLPWGDGSRALFGWGALGAVTIVTYFSALKLIGAAETTLLQASQGLLVAAMGPVLSRQRHEAGAIISVTGGMAGMALVLKAGEASGGGSEIGRLLALASGISAGCAYLVISHCRKKYAPEVVGFYWCFMSLMGVLLLGFGTGASWRLGGAGVLWLLGAGLAASSAQWLTTLAYQNAPPAYVSACSYLIPVLGLAWECLLEGKAVGHAALLGSALVLVCGGMLPLVCLWRQPGGRLSMPGTKNSRSGTGARRGNEELA